MNRRRLLLGVAGAGVLAAVGGGAGYAFVGRDRPVALVYRGPASCSGCSEAVAALLAKMPAGYQVRYCGPGEDLPLSAESLAGAVVYAQPGGGEVRTAWRRLRNSAEDVRAFVSRGGSYLGFCLGAYLAGSGQGYGLLDRVDVDGYIYTAGASVRDTDDTVVAVRWRDRPRHMFFQDGAAFHPQPGAPATVLATYDTGVPAAIVATYGSGRVGLTGPHPEADRSWYTDAGLTNPDGIRFDLGQDLIESTMRA
ncbi:BPL-N domain-containing protein [Dactylosporangium sp. AC04546]|uniref:BPL-N domain-containing protein n=1 Tax=Dactylosporangium sp. AC04546 TaxID=2862460 RepID=UPI001EE03F0F|nr:BPL-N domain-containing protein [Dactylosporangium sp. AC04546]WVK87922.1 BPL-N domain-containing protein [Dactylosporangium sp. AC04546]